MKKTLLRALALPALFVLSAASHAALFVYTTEEGFRAATTEQGVDTYTGLAVNSQTASPLVRNAGAYGYTASASTSTFYGINTESDPWLSTNLATDFVTFDRFTNGVQAIGGNFFGSNLGGEFADGSVTLTATDLSGALTRTIVNASTTSFLGFVSTDALVSLRLSAVQGAGTNLWPTADNLILARRLEATEVPEPGSIALLFAGLGLMGMRARRRNA